MPRGSQEVLGIKSLQQKSFLKKKSLTIKRGIYSKDFFEKYTIFYLQLSNNKQVI